MNDVIVNSLSKNSTPENMSMGPGLYRLNEAKINNTVAYPWAPTTRIQRMGASGAPLQTTELMDIDSELKDITRKLSKNIGDKYSPQEYHEIKGIQHFDDGFFHPEYTRQMSDHLELKAVAMNRWEPLFFDPQKNCLEPFKRLGLDTVNQTLDNYQECQQKPLYSGEENKFLSKNLENKVIAQNTTNIPGKNIQQNNPYDFNQ
tara:strand:+ start:28 stop:636 length:609 start_codon:yes stop_codon:yes gene_type:complete